MASHRKGLLPIKIGHTELRVLMQFCQMLVYLFEVWFFFSNDHDEG